MDNYVEIIERAKKLPIIASDYTYSSKDVILYHLGLGIGSAELPFVFEGHSNFQVVPTFGVISTHFSKTPYQMVDIVPNYDLRRLLHGEQFLEICKYPIPTAAKVSSRAYLIEVIDKGNAAIVRKGCDTIDIETGERLFYNETVTFVRGSGGFGGISKGSDRGPATAANTAPSRQPDFIQEQKVDKDLAAIYRLSGDYNPLHIDPEFAKGGGLDAPILHGLASFGISGKHIYSKYGKFKNIKVRFSGTVLPGQTLVTEAWKEKGDKVVFQVRIKETGRLAISNAGVELLGAAPGLKL